MSRAITANIDVIPRGVPPVISVSQYDTDFTIVFSLYSSGGDLTIASGTTAALSGTKPDGTGYSADCTINTTAKTVTVTGAAQMTAVPGKAVFELALFKSSKRLSTSNFILDVEPAALDADTVISDTEINRFVGLENSISSLAETATTAASNAASSASAAASSASSAASAAQTERGKYISSNSNGIMIAKMDGGTTYTPTNAPSTLTNIYEDADGVHVRRGTTVKHTVTIDGDEKNAINVNAAATTTDGKLYEAITALGWASDVISSGMLGLKNLLTNVLASLYDLTQKTQYSMEATVLDDQELSGADAFTLGISKTGKKAIALAGYSITAATTNPANHFYCVAYGITPKDNFTKILFNIRNTSTQAARLKITAYVLYVNT